MDKTFLERYKEMYKKIPHWLDQILTVCETWPARVAGALLLGVLNLCSKSILAAALLAFFWFLLVMALRKAKVRTWKLMSSAVVLAILMSVFWPSIKKEVNPPAIPKQGQNQKPAAEIPKIVKPKIKNGDFEQGLYGLDYWQSKERPLHLSTISPETTVASTAITLPEQKTYVMTVGKDGRNGSNGLIIECPNKPAAEKYPALWQRLEGLVSNATYKIHFYLYLKDDGSKTVDSLYIALGTPWQIGPNEEGKIFSKEIKLNGWTKMEIKLKNHDETSANFTIVVNDITHGLILDDISIEEMK